MYHWTVTNTELRRGMCDKLNLKFLQDLIIYFSEVYVYIL